MSTIEEQLGSALRRLGDDAPPLPHNPVDLVSWRRAATRRRAVRAGAAVVATVVVATGIAGVFPALVPGQGPDVAGTAPDPGSFADVEGWAGLDAGQRALWRECAAGVPYLGDGRFEVAAHDTVVGEAILATATEDSGLGSRLLCLPGGGMASTSTGPQYPGPTSEKPVLAPPAGVLAGALVYDVSPEVSRLAVQLPGHDDPTEATLLGGFGILPSSAQGYPVEAYGQDGALLFAGIPDIE